MAHISLYAGRIVDAVNRLYIYAITYFPISSFVQQQFDQGNKNIVRVHSTAGYSFMNSLDSSSVAQKESGKSRTKQFRLKSGLASIS